MRKYAIGLALAVLLALSACGTAQKGVSVEELLNLGEQYLLELDYEQALAQFLKVIDLEPMNPRGYTGAAEAYLGLGDADSAVAILEQGFARTGDRSIEQLAERYRADTTALSLLANLLDCFEREGVEGADALIRQEAYYSLQDAYPQGELYVGEYGPDGRRQGTGLSVYYGGFYYGQWENGVRSGYGIFMYTYKEYGWYTYEGEWADDLPNGQGTEIREVTDSREEIRGTYQDGLHHGQMHLVEYDKDRDHEIRWSPITAVDGVYQAIIVEGDYGDEGYYLVAVTDDRISWKYSAGQQYSVFGVLEEWPG